MKRTIPLLALVAALSVTAWLSDRTSAQDTAYNYGSFDHKEHDAALDKSAQERIACDVCHRRDDASSQLYFPGHNACIQCHATQFTSQSLQICAVCHKDVATQGRALKDFPAQRKDYGVRFDGAGNKSQHVVHMKEALPDGTRMSCSFCHAAQGSNMAFPSHPECYACHTPGANSKAASQELSTCSVCHPGATEPNSEMRRLVSTRRNDALPYRFRHLDHNRSGRIGNDCAKCHNDAAGIHVASTATREHRVKPGFNCYECHRGGGLSRITETSCGSCHGVVVFPPL